MPSKHTKDIEVGDWTFRLHRLCGFDATGAHAELVSVCGEGVAAILMMGDAAFTGEKSALSEDKRFQGLTLTMLHGALKQGRMGRAAINVLAREFIFGHVEIVFGPDEARMIGEPKDLDELLDGEEDAQIWSTLLWKSIIYSVGPTTAVTGIGGGTQTTAQT